MWVHCGVWVASLLEGSPPADVVTVHCVGVLLCIVRQRGHVGIHYFLQHKPKGPTNTKCSSTFRGIGATEIWVVWRRGFVLLSFPESTAAVWVSALFNVVSGILSRARILLKMQPCLAQWFIENYVCTKWIDKVLPEQLKYGHDLINMRFISRVVDARSVAMAIPSRSSGVYQSGRVKSPSPLPKRARAKEWDNKYIKRKKKKRLTADMGMKKEEAWWYKRENDNGSV